MAKWAVMWAGSIAVFVILVFLPPNAFAPIGDFWCETSTCNQNFQFRKLITIDGTKVGTDNTAGFLTDFPFLVNFTGSDFTDVEDGALSSGADIRFTTQGGADLEYEIEEYDEGINKMAIWVKSTSTGIAKDTDTGVYMYYGNSGASSTANAANVWDSNYKGVWHLPEDPSGGAPQMLDSTSNNNDGTSAGSMTTSNQVRGQIDGSLDFEGTDDLVNVPDDASLDIQEAIAISFWFLMDGDSADNDFPRLVSKGQSSGTDGAYGIFIQDTGGSTFNWGLRFVDAGGTGHDADISEDFGQKDGDWHYVVATYSNADNKGKIYFDGDLKESTPISGDTAIKQTPDSLHIGNGNGDAQRHFNGAIDEVRISNTARSADVVKTEYNNQNSPSTFYSVGSQEVYRSTGGLAGGDITKPSFTKLFAENEYPLTIRDQSFTLSQLSGKVETTKVYIDEPVQIKLRAYENKGPSNVWEVLLHTNLHGVQRELYQSDTYVIYKQNNPLQVIDPNGFFSDVKVSTSTEGKFEIVYDITFAKKMEKSDIVFQVRDRSGNSAMLTAHDAWEIVEASTEQSQETSENLLTEESKAFSTDKKSYLRGDTIEFSGKTTKEIQSRDFVTILIHNSDNRLITTATLFPKSDGNFKIQLNTENDFGINDTFNATALIGEEIIGSVLFDVSMDKDPIVFLPEIKTEQKQEPTLETEPVTEEPVNTLQSPLTQGFGMKTTTKLETKLVIEEPKNDILVQKSKIPGFPDPTKSPQHYIDRYNNELEYKEWFDKVFPNYSIEQIVGYPESKLASFLDPIKSPQYYIDRYNNESAYKEWFDKILPNNSIYELVGMQEPIKKQIPGWIKNNAKWWSEGKIGESDFVGGIQHMIKEKIIDIPDLPQSASTQAEEKVPDWIKNNAKWWAEGLIGEDDFVNGIKYLVENGIIRV